MQRWCKQLGDGYVGARATRGDLRYRFVGKRQKSDPRAVRSDHLTCAPTMRRCGGSGKRVGAAGRATGYRVAGTRLGASTSWRGFVPNTPTSRGWRSFTRCCGPDGRELVSMNKAFEMVRAVADGLQEQRQREIAERADEPVAARERDHRDDGRASIDAGKVATRANERVTEDGKKSYDRVISGLQGSHGIRGEGGPGGCSALHQDLLCHRALSMLMSSSRGSRWR